LRTHLSKTPPAAEASGVSLLGKQGWAGIRCCRVSLQLALQQTGSSEGMEAAAVPGHFAPHDGAPGRANFGFGAL